MTIVPSASGTFSETHHFLIRRLHSLLGLVPLGVFLVLHLLVNSSINFGGAEFQTQVDRIHALGPFLVPVEIVGIFLPLLFHGLLGVQIWLSGQPNLAACRYGGNYRYVLQRVTGGITLVFIVYHLWHMHWLGAGLGGGRFDPQAPNAAITAARAINETLFGIPAVAIYGIGVLSTVYHLANGIWTSLITWGVTVGPSSQRVAGYVCAVFGIALGLVGLSAVRGFGVYNEDTVTVEVAPAAGSDESSGTESTIAGKDHG